MAEQIISTMITVAIVIIAITIVFILGRPVIEKASITGKISEAESSLRTIENNINEVAGEGIGSSRIFTVRFPGKVAVLDEQNAMQFQIASPVPVFDYLSRSFVTDNLMRISERDVFCSEGTNLVMENKHLRVEMQRVSRNSSLDTKNNIISILQKDTGSTIYPVDTSIYIDIYPETSKGTGYSELLGHGAQPVCIAHFFVDAAIDYDIYYKLYSGADFLVVEVANIA